MIIFAFGFSTILNILIFLIILCLTISIHELGHLTFAKNFNVYCYEYSIGFGKAIYKNKKGETHFCIRLIPLGGFVRMAGEEGVEDNEVLLDNNEKPIPKERIFGNIKKGPKIMILAAGGLFNMILAYICFFVVLVFNGVPITNQPIVSLVSNQPLVQEIQKEIQNGNLALKEVPNQIYIHEMNISYTTEQSFDEVIITHKVKNWEDINTLLNQSQENAKKESIRHLEIIFSASKKSEKFSIDLYSKTHLVEESQSELYNFDTIGITMMNKKYNLLEAIPQTYKFMFDYFIEVCKAFGRLFVGHTEQLSGLVGIYKTVDASASSGAGLIGMIYIAGAISFSLGFFNLMPILALVGGRIVFVLI